MFIRVYRRKEDKEILVNLDLVWKIEVEYVLPDPKTRLGFSTSLRQGIENPQAIRVYHLFVGNEKIAIAASPDDPVTAAIEKIYKDSIKGVGHKDKDQ